MILFKSPGPAVPFSELKSSPKSIRSEIIALKRPESVLILVPTKRKIRNLLREIIRSYPGKSRSFGRINIATIETLAFDMLRQQEVIFREISAAVSLVLHSQCYEENKNGLRYFPKDGIPQGTLLKLKNVISEYKRHPITPLELMEEVEEKLFDEGEELKVKDLILLYEAYNRKCASLSLKEIGDIYSDLNALDTVKIKNGFGKCFPSVETIIVEGYDNLTGSEIALLDRLSSSFTVFLDFDYSEKNENLFGHLTGTMETLRGQYGWKDFRDGEAQGGEFKKHVARSLSKVNVRKKEAFSGKMITEIEARDREKEVELIAREIKHILSGSSADGKKTEPHEICVVFKNISDYSSFVREKFEACRIPFNLTDRKMLSSSPPVLAVLNLLTIRSDNYYYKDIMRALSSGFISIRKKNGRYVDFNNLLETAGKLKIVSGYENWVSSLKEIIELIETESKKPSSGLREDDPDNYYDEDYVRRLGKDRLKFEWTLEDLEEIHRLLKPLGEPQTPSEFRKNLFSLIKDTKILYRTLGDLSRKYFEEKGAPDTESDLTPDEEPAGSAGSMDENKSEQEQEQEPKEGYMFNLGENARGFDKFIETITDLLDLIGSIEEGKKYELEFFIRQIKTSVMRERYNLVQKSNYGVTVTTLEELRGLEFDCLFIGGLVDNCFPTPYRPEVFVAESRKRENGKLSKPEIHQTGERYLFYQSLSSFRSRLYLSYPAGSDNQQFEKSVFLKELENIVQVNVKKESDYSHYLYTVPQVLKVLHQSSSFNNGTGDILSAAGIKLQTSKIKDAMKIDSDRISPEARGTRFSGVLNDPEDPLKEVRKEEYHLSEDGSYEIFTQQAAGSLSSYSSRTYSVSQLETYAKCPFQYFSNRVLSLGTIESPKEEIESNELGTLLHKIFCEFYRTFGPERKVTDENSDEALSLIRSLAEKLSRNYFKSPLDFYEREKLFGIGGREEDSILYRFIKTEASDKTGFVPWQFEKSFGSGDTPGTVNFELNGVKLQGQIDRIDINRELKRFRVIDYKLNGSKPTSGDLKNGISLQLPVYLHVAKRIIEEELDDPARSDYQPDTAIIYSLRIKAGEFGVKKVIADESRKTSPDEAMKVSMEKVSEYMAAITSGAFYMPPEKKKPNVCKYCSYSNICRI